MENVYRFISDLGNYLNLIRRTGEAEIEMKNEPKSKTVMRDHYLKLFGECVNMYKHINQTFDEELIELSHSITTEINKRDLNGKVSLYNQLFDTINPILIWLDKMNSEGGFSLYGLHELRWVELEDTQDGGKREVEKSFPVTLQTFAENLNLNLTRIQILINERFKFLKQNQSSETEKAGIKSPSYLYYILQLYYEKGCKPLTKNIVDVFADDNKLNKNELKKRLGELHKNNLTAGAKSYKAHDNANNAKAFKEAYEHLLKFFESNNNMAFESVTNDYNQLKETYPAYMI